MKLTGTMYWLAALVLVAGSGPGCSKKSTKATGKKAQPTNEVQKDQTKALPDSGTAKPEARGTDQQANEETKSGQGADQAQADDKIPAGAAQAQVLIVSWKGAMDGVKRTKAQAKALADKVLTETGKTPFEKLVAKYSDGPNKKSGGKVPAMTKKDASEVFQPVFALKVGQVSKVIEGPNGYYIFKRIK